MTRRVLALTALASVLITVWAHAHSNEPPHMKYSRDVNEKAQVEAEEGHLHHDHHHDHGHDCGHDHSHDHAGHDHAHGHGHDHSHEHGHDHAHGHAAHGHDHHHHEEEVHVHTHSHGHGHHHHAPSTAEKFVPYDKDSVFAFLNDAKTRLWTYSIGSTLVISAFPFFILMFIPIQNNVNEDSSLLKVLLAFGAGGLLGDAFLHLIPHSSGGHDHGHDHGHSHHHGHGEEGHNHVHDMSVGFWVLGGLLTFFIVEKFVRIVRGEDHHHGHSHGHSHTHKPAAVKKLKTSDTEETDDEKSESDIQKEEDLKNRPTKNNSDEAEPPRRLAVAAFLNLAADFLHNFTDGLAIGASFIAGSSVGFMTMFTVLFHEVPHEIGDFAILIQSGFSKKKAMFTQLLTAVGALCGCVIALWSVDAYALAEAAETSWVLPFTAGGFIYIATVTVLPELLENSSFLLSIAEVVALGVGVGCMYLIALFE